MRNATGKGSGAHKTAAGAAHRAMQAATKPNRTESSKAPAGIAKCPTGIRGLDDITQGGLPRGRPTQAAAQNAKDQKYVLKLYVAGTTPRSKEAIRTVTAICEENLAGRYDLEVIDLYQNPTLAQGEQIVAAPTLIKKLPLPPRKFIGSMADKDRILVGLDLRPKRA
jgi:circadian clock protein KaiB